MTRLTRIEYLIYAHPTVPVDYGDVRWLAEQLRTMYMLYGDPDAPPPTGAMRFPVTGRE